MAHILIILPSMRIKKAVTVALLSMASFAQADVVLTMGGDVNFSKNRVRVQADGFSYRDGKVYPWSAMTGGVAPLLTGDFNFINIETVVTANPRLTNLEKAFAFMSHPNSIEHLIGIGFNLFNMANNHSYDYGNEGMYDTLQSMNELQRKYPHIRHTGVGTREQNLSPVIFEKNGIKFAMASVSIINGQFLAGTNKVGLLNVRSDKDYRDVVLALKNAPVDFRILSIHGGTEGQVELDRGQKERYRYAIEQGGVNLVIGHHPHVARPIEYWKGGMIYYSLGNYFMLGSADITRASNIGKDWGMFSRLYIEKDPATQKARIEAVEVVPLTNTHFKATSLINNKASDRIRALNSLGADQLGGTALHLSIDGLTGKGFRCAEGMRSVRAKSMCASVFPIN